MSPPIKPTTSTAVRTPKDYPAATPSAAKPAPKSTPPRDRFDAGQLVLSWRRAQIAGRGFDPDTGVDVRAVHREVTSARAQKYEQDLERALAEQKKLDGK